MADEKVCPKCSGRMTQGRIMKYNEYTARNRYIYVFAPDGEPGPDLSKMFSANPIPAARKALMAFCCDQCGFVEFYGQIIP